MRPLILVAAVVILQACAKSPDSTSSVTQTASKTSTDGWLTYEDDMFKAQYPPGSQVTGASNGIQNQKHPMLFLVPPPHANLTGIGGLMLQPDTVTKNMLLRDALQSDILRYKKERGAVLMPPRDIPVTNGRCISAVITSPAEFCPKGTGSCFAGGFLTQCDGPNGARYNAHTALSVGPSRDALSPQAQKEAATYERMLRSLEFKKS